MMQIIEEEGHELLRWVGFTEVEINRLSQLRQNYRISMPLDYARLQFVRWLVTTGRLADQVEAKDELGQEDLTVLEEHPRQSFLWRGVRTLINQDRGYVSSRRPKPSGDAS